MDGGAVFRGEITSGYRSPLSPNRGMVQSKAMQTLAPQLAPPIAGTTSIGIYGSAGRMGRAIGDAIEAAGATLAGGVDAGEDPAPLARTANVLVDFSTASAIEAHLSAARAAGTAIVIGTTGLSPQHQSMIDDAARDIAILQTGNTSLGVTLLGILVREAAARLGPDWDVEIVEMHHKHKVDAPSGHGPPAWRRRRQGSRIVARRTARRQPRRPGRRANRRHDRLRELARRIGNRRSQRDFRRRRRTDRAQPPRRRSLDLRTGCCPCRDLAGGAACRTLPDGRRARPVTL